MTIAFGSEAIKGSENNDALKLIGGLPFLTIAFGSEAIKGSENKITML